jgi:pilus assembly protein Flp/PilA
MVLTRLRQYVSGLRQVSWAGVLRDRRAVTSVEYGLIALIIILGIVVGSNRIGLELSRTFNNVSSEL